MVTDVSIGNRDGNCFYNFSDYQLIRRFFINSIRCFQITGLYCNSKNNNDVLKEKTSYLRHIFFFLIVTGDCDEMAQTR